MITDTISLFLEEGGQWAGISIILGVWGWFNQKKVYEVQEKRLEDNKISIDTLQKSTHAANKMAEALTELSHRLDRREET